MRHTAAMSSFAALFASLEIDGWRDEQVLLAAGQLNELTLSLRERVNRTLDEADTSTLIDERKDFFARRIAPLLDAAIEREVKAIVDTANAALRRIRQHEAVLHRVPDERPDASAHSGGLIEAALEYTPFVAVTASALMSGGWALIGAPMIGGFAREALATRLRMRMRDRAHARINATLVDGTARHPSLLTQIIHCFTSTAASAKGDLT